MASGESRARTVFVVDGDASVREAVAGVVHMMNLRCRTYAHGEEFLSDFDAQSSGCIVMEVELPDISGLVVCRRLVARGATLPVIFLTELESVPVAVQAMREGALNWLQKPFRPHELWEAIEEAVVLDRNRQKARKRRDLMQRRLEILSDRERQVLVQLGQGLTPRDIASELGITVRAVELCRSRLLQKLEIETPLEVYEYALAAQGHQSP